jgi:hypothetical protein
LNFLSAEKILFAHIDDDDVVDLIPLTEIKTVREMVGGDGEGTANDPNEFMIETSPEGYNSGRTYYLQADSSSSCRAISSKFLHCATVALERAHARTAFEQAQQRVRKVYRASWFQNSVALLIIAVSPPPSSTAPHTSCSFLPPRPRLTQFIIPH